MKLQSAALLGSLTFALVSIGCSSSSTLSGSGGSNGTGSGGTNSGSGGATSTGGSGTGTGGGSASCTNVTPCGGSANGTWTVKSSCLTISGDLDVQTLFFLSCPTGHVTGTLQVTGTFTANANGTFTDATTTTGTEMLSLPAACKVLSGAPVTCDRIGSVMAGSYYSDATCVDAASGGGCDCTGTVNQTGSLGHVVGDPQTDGNFTTGSNTLTITQDSMKYGYCASGTMLTLTPQGSSPTTTGSIVLQSGSTSGTGGSTGGGGKGGSTGAGGTGGSGGKAGNGGGGRGTGGSAGGTGTGGTPGPKGMGPCDIYGAANMPCAAAFSMVRALSSKYAGPLYQVRNHSSSMNQGSGGSTMEVPQTPDGYADTSVQDTFCMGTTCTVSILYDQSGNGNDLKSAPSGPAGNGSSGTADYESSATKLSVTAGGHKVYALYMNAVEGYRTGLNVKGKNMPGMNMDEGIYELADGTHYGTACCWDFGNVTTNPAQYHTMNTIFFGTGYWGKGAPGGAKPGPWFEADFEGGVWAGGSSAGDPGGSNGTVANTMDPALPVDFAFATLKTSKPSSTMYSLRVANAATATDLTTAYNGKAPTTNWDNPGGILLGVGGDNSNNSAGTFYEGAIVSGLPTDATDLAVLKNVQAVGYKK